MNIENDTNLSESNKMLSDFNHFKSINIPKAIE